MRISRRKTEDIAYLKRKFKKLNRRWNKASHAAFFSLPLTGVSLLVALKRQDDPSLLISSLCSLVSISLITVNNHYCTKTRTYADKIIGYYKRKGLDEELYKFNNHLADSTLTYTSHWPFWAFLGKKAKDTRYL